MKRIALALLIACPLAAEPGVAPPRLGMILDAQGNARLLTGIPGNLNPSDSLTAGALSVGCNAVKTPDAILTFDENGNPLASIPVDDGPALFACDSQGRLALVYTNQLLDSGFVPLDLVPPQGTPLQILAPNANEVVWLLARPDGLWSVRQSLADCSILEERALPDATLPAVLLSANAYAFADGTAVVVSDPDNTQRRIETGAPPSILQPLCPGWITTGTAAVRLIPGKEQVSQIPEAQQ